MQNVERLSITLPTEMVRLIRAKVEEGGYASNSEVIREAMRAWAAREQLHAERLQQLRARIAEADADPRPSLSEDELDAHFAMRTKA
jgi:antitoxin ParD1/3/4